MFSTKAAERADYGSPDTGFSDYKIDRKPGDPTRREFTYFMLGGGRLLYASVARLAVIRVCTWCIIICMSKQLIYGI